ncbi:hypothetical protein [Faecalispora anaeroviscerum]|uniref:hypothetical protein n=1 Tax=Faecalispora anaeroviscerum TaxID=2991836 RepID=UPI0024B8C10C|nr:hypothetical protein [Faecalispora anaeroviscerum]
MCEKNYHIVKESPGFKKSGAFYVANNRFTVILRVISAGLGLALSERSRWLGESGASRRAFFFLSLSRARDYFYCGSRTGDSAGAGLPLGPGQALPFLRKERKQRFAKAPPLESVLWNGSGECCQQPPERRSMESAHAPCFVGRGSLPVPFGGAPLSSALVGSGREQ